MLCGCDGGASGDQRWIHLCPLHTAAPDLLAALERIEDLDWSHDSAESAMVKVQVEAATAIAKAKGEHAT
jgi:hypothetical protein